MHEKCCTEKYGDDMSPGESVDGGKHLRMCDNQKNNETWAVGRGKGSFPKPAQACPSIIRKPPTPRRILICIRKGKPNNQEGITVMPVSTAKVGLKKASGRYLGTQYSCCQVPKSKDIKNETEMQHKQSGITSFNLKRKRGNGDIRSLGMFEIRY